MFFCKLNIAAFGLKDVKCEAREGKPRHLGKGTIEFDNQDAENQVADRVFLEKNMVFYENLPFSTFFAHQKKCSPETFSPLRKTPKFSGACWLLFFYRKKFITRDLAGLTIPPRCNS